MNWSNSGQIIKNNYHSTHFSGMGAKVIQVDLTFIYVEAPDATNDR